MWQSVAKWDARTRAESIEAYAIFAQAGEQFWFRGSTNQIYENSEGENKNKKKPLYRIVYALVHCRLDIPVGLAYLHDLRHFPTEFPD